ncbi:hypothetical protein RD792_007648 [Penstemon davidsonii]|uniref:Non-specific lipid-transfer protein n=1 Tax=Penstemon davidsonii TaxID=160366 RepID=A0ABR0D6Z3_9LAMI|nr:hypothetical protein RD792_007640 [Penstemon davidsonii]KAK4485040.1 hypothetical protein RD792_007648 [Penstemon davidsonii]
MGYNSSCLVTLVVLAMIISCNLAPTTAISCTEAIEYLMPCQTFLFGWSGITAPCCQGAQSLAIASLSDRKSVCQCLKQAALSLNVNLDNAKQLPALCKISLPFEIRPDIDCNA